MNSAEIIVGIIVGLAINEMCDISPWAARKLVQLAARLRYRDPARAATRSEELVSLIEERPGKLFKLATAFGFWTAALASRIHSLKVRNVRYYRRGRWTRSRTFSYTASWRTENGLSGVQMELSDKSIDADKMLELLHLPNDVTEFTLTRKGITKGGLVAKVVNFVYKVINNRKC